MESTSWKIGDLMTQLRKQMDEVNETINQVFSELDKQKTENDIHCQKQLEQIEQERQKWEEEKATAEKLVASASTTVDLIVSGEKMSVLRTTLTAGKGSLLATMFSGKYDEILPKDTNGHIVLSYDPEAFSLLMGQLHSWSNSSTKHVLRPPAKCEESFLELVRLLKFNEQSTDNKKSIISTASSTDSEEEINQPTDTQTTTDNNAPTTVQTEQQVEQPADGETNTTTVTQSQQEAKPSTNDQATITDATTVTQPQQEAKPSTNDQATANTNDTTATQPQQEAKQSTTSKSNATASADKVSQPEQEIQRFHTKCSDHIQLTENDRKCEKISKHGDYQSILGKLTYASGIHRIRLKVEKGSIDIFFGICSEDQVPNGAYLFDKPSVHGWLGHGYLVKNGQSPERGLPVFETDDIVELTINCDEHKLSIHNEKSGGKNSMKVNKADAPFPWCLLILIHFTGGRLSLL